MNSSGRQAAEEIRADLKVSTEDLDHRKLLHSRGILWDFIEAPLLITDERRGEKLADLETRMLASPLGLK
jgi:hypothetical protein